jgi:prevent-host-death family protein
VASTQDIISITDLKTRAAELVKQVNEEGRTLVVTQNGTARVVVIDAAEFDRMQNALALLTTRARRESSSRG